MFKNRRSPALHGAFLILALSVCAAAPAADKAADKAPGGNPAMEMHRSMMKGAKESMSMKPSGNMDHDFATMMRHHHMQGVEMAQYQLKHGKDQKMRDMAQKIMESQKKEI